MKTFICSAFLVAIVIAAPTPTVTEDLLNELLTTPSATITASSQLSSIVAGLEEDIAAGDALVSIVLDVVDAIIPTEVPSNITGLLASVVSVYASHPTNFLESALELVLDGLAVKDLVGDIIDQTSVVNSYNNTNPISASPAIYPQKSPNDAPYSVAEADLKAALYIPPTFQYGKVPPIVFIPGTASYGGADFEPNFGKLFTGSDYADPVYLNIPGFQLLDVQVNSEYVAYAINYVSAISGHQNISVLSWSAGSLNIAWAFTYWPSTVEVVSNNIAISGDYHGTELAYLACPGFPERLCSPSILQQEYNSTFIQTLRNAGGSSAYVPTTSVYSSLDEIVEPQTGMGASAYLFDERNVGVSNTDVTTTCTILQPGGTVYDHEGVLFNPLAFALAKDALVNGGPGQLSRINVTDACQMVVPEGLSLEDVLFTETLAVVATISLVVAPYGVFEEPPIMAYAQKDIPA